MTEVKKLFDITEGHRHRSSGQENHFKIIRLFPLIQ